MDSSLLPNGIVFVIRHFKQPRSPFGIRQSWLAEHATLS